MKTGLIFFSFMLTCIFIQAQKNRISISETLETKNYKMKSKQELKQILSPMQFHVTQENGTEYPFTGKYWDFFEKGKYQCVCCTADLFESDSKFHSSCGWPSFSDVEELENIVLKDDDSHGMHRVEVRCGKCDAHLGHVFNDGPPPTGLRYCINSASIVFVPHEKD